jgi:hypothetical protein
VVWCVGRRDSSGVEGRIDVTEDCTEHREERKGEWSECDECHHLIVSRSGVSVTARTCASQYR